MIYCDKTHFRKCTKTGYTGIRDLIQKRVNIEEEKFGYGYEHEYPTFKWGPSGYYKPKKTEWGELLPTFVSKVMP